MSAGGPGRPRSRRATSSGTVKEGLFLIDRDYRIGQARSERTGNPAAAAISSTEIGFDDLLFGLVPEKTLDTALKYVKLFWGERANENLIQEHQPARRGRSAVSARRRGGHPLSRV